MGKRRDRASPYNTSLSIPPPPPAGGACGPKKPWKLGPFRRGQWLSLDPPCGSVIEYNVCIVYSVFYLLRCPNFFCTKRKMENWFSLHPWERIYSDLFRASDISRKKKQNFAGFSGANSQKNRPISRDFRGRKVKIRRKIVWFPGILAEKSQISKDFQGQILRKIGQFHGKFRGKLCQETISKK